MHRLRSFLRICFGYLTLISLVVSIFMVRNLLWMHQQSRPFAWPSHDSRQLASLTLLALSRLVLFFPLILAGVYGTAWWTLKHGRRSARSWAIAASILLILSTAALVTARLTLWPAGRHHLRASYLLFQLFFFAIGILGVIVFTRTSSASMLAGHKDAAFTATAPAPSSISSSPHSH